MLVAWEVTLALETKSRVVAAGRGSFDAAAAADEEEVEPTELRVAGQEEEEPHLPLVEGENALVVRSPSMCNGNGHLCSGAA